MDEDPQESGNTKASPGGLGAVLVDWEVSTEEFLATVIFGDDATLDFDTRFGQKNGFSGRVGSGERG
jgi:hypothetical protein